MRNSRVAETTQLGSLADHLSLLLPSDWTVRVEPLTPDGPFDAVVRMTAPSGELVELHVAVKRWTTAPTSAVAGVLARLQQQSAIPLLLVTDYTNRPIREAAVELGVNFVDDTGWVWIKVDKPPIFIRAQGAKNRSAPRVANEVTRLSGKATGRLIRELLTSQAPVGVRELAARAGTSPGSAAKLLPTLVADGALERDDQGQVVEVHRRRLLERWTRDYTFLDANGVVLDFLAPRGLPQVLDRLAGNPAGNPAVCVTGSAAGRTYLTPGIVPVVPLTLLTVYARDPRALGDDLGLTRIDRRSSNVIITAPQDPDLLESSDRDANGLPRAPLPQVLADLLTMPGRESILADQLMDQLAEADPWWGHR